MESRRAQSPREDLRRLITLFSVDFSDENGSIGGIHNEAAVDAFVELRAQAAHDDSFRTKLLREDEAIRTRFVRIIQRGIDDGVFRDVDPDSVTEFILTVLDGALFRYSLTNDRTNQVVYDQLDEYLQCRLLANSSK